MRQRFYALIPLALIAGACSFITPYKLDVPQGNPVTADMVAKLKVGMTRTQVKFLLGTPMLSDTFHLNRWDYQFYESRGGKESRNKRYYVLFDGDRVTGFGGETLEAKASVAEEAPEQMKNRPPEDKSKQQGAPR